MPLLDLFWTMLWFFLFVAWIWLVITVIADIFRSDDLSGWGKGLWTVFIILLPWLGILVYLIARGRSMGERNLRDMQAREAATREYIQSVTASSAAPSTADELGKLSDLKVSGVITEEEFAAQKAKILAG
jgi:hypothetical protein